jgi:hypothetical protein
VCEAYHLVLSVTKSALFVSKNCQHSRSAPMSLSDIVSAGGQQLLHLVCLRADCTRCRFPLLTSRKQRTDFWILEAPDLSAAGLSASSDRRAGAPHKRCAIDRPTDRSVD